MRKAVIIDAYSQGNYHEVVNQGYLMMIAGTYDSVQYIGEQKSCDNMKSLLRKTGTDDSKIRFQPKHIHKPNTANSLFLKVWWFLKVSLLNYWYYMKTDEDADVFFNNNIHLGIFLINYFSFRKHNRVFDMCHAEMEMIDSSEASTPARRIGTWLYRLTFCKMTIKPHINFILLSPVMAAEFKTLISNVNRERIHGMDHPYLRPMLSHAGKNAQQGTLRIGIPGAITPLRGLPEIRALLDGFPDNGTRLYCISYCREKIDSPYFVFLNNTGKLLSYEEYGTYITSMDMLLLLYKPGAYRFTASGAALEAIWQLKPIICLRNRYIEYLFDKFGPMGYICDDIRQIKNVIDTVSHEQLMQFDANLRRAREALHPCNVIRQFQQITMCL